MSRSRRARRRGLRPSLLEALEPRRVLAGLGDSPIPLPEGPDGQIVEQLEGLLRSPAQFAMYGKNIDGDMSRFPKPLPRFGSSSLIAKRESGATTRLDVATSPTRIVENESTDPFLVEINDTRDGAEAIPLGFGAGQSTAIDVRASLSEPPLPSQIASVEDDGSILLANLTNLLPGNAVLAVGTVGDGPQNATGDFDFYQIPDVLTGQLITVGVAGQQGLDPAVAIYNSVGEVVATNDDTATSFNSFLAYQAEEDDDYYVAVVGSGFFGFQLPRDPFQSDSGVLPQSVGPYEATIGLDYGDSDYFSIQLNPGDVLGVNLQGSANQVTLLDVQGQELIGNREAGTVFNAASPLPDSGTAVISFVATEPGTYFLRALGDRFGNYKAELRLFRPAPESQPPGTKQILFLDFDGETIDTNIFGMPGPATLSPLADFLPDWNLTARDENAVIDAIIERVRENFRDLGASGVNGDFDRTGRPGDFGIEIRNSRDHADPFGLPNVSRVIFGGTIAETGIPTIGISQSVDAGNLVKEETAIVLLDLLSGPESDPTSINSLLVNTPQVKKPKLVGTAVGNIGTHEAGHFYGIWHTDPLNNVLDLMDSGGTNDVVRNNSEAGVDGILGTQDDIDYDFREDEYDPLELFTGIQNVPDVLAYSLPTGRGRQTTVASGVKWNDLDRDGVRDTGEPGVAGVRIYVDINGDGEFGIGEPAAVTGPGGGYVLRNVPRGTFAVRESLQPGWVSTFPANGQHLVTFNANQQVTGLDFGNRQGSGDDNGFDYGDAPAPYPTTFAENGARHGIVAGFRLGSRIDGEANGRPSPFAGGDDNDGDDEDGVVFLDELVPNAPARIEITVSNGSQPGGLLQGWIDFDGDGRWSGPGEQILRDVAPVEGVNRFTIQVPGTAVQGNTFARFRYGYEPGLGVTGAAVAGEVEDYLVEVTRGGPTANDDSFTVRRNASDVVLDVLGNDQVRPGTGTAITAITSPSAGGSVRIAGTTLVYSPALDFAGTETFTYTLRDQNGLDDSATVSVFVQPDLVQIRLAAAQLNGQPITRLDVGQSFLLQGFVRDISDAGGGVFAAYLDVEYPANVAAVTGSIMYGPDYPNGQSGSTSTPGLIDEVGAFDGLDQLGPNEAILFSLPMQATAAGKAVFDASPADQLPLHNVLLFGRDDPVPVEQIEYRDLTLTVGTSSNGVLSNPRNALDVNDDSNVSPLDALLVINQLNGASQALAATALGGRQSLYLDVSADGQVSPLDALLVINALNRQSSSVAAVSTALPAGQRRSDIFSALDDDSLSSVKKRAEQDALEPALDLIGRDVANGL